MTFLYPNLCYNGTALYMSLIATKPVFRVSDKARLKPVSSATGTSFKIENCLVASLDMILSNKRITKVLIRLRGFAGWSAPLLFANPEDRFSRVEAHIVFFLSSEIGINSAGCSMDFHCVTRGAVCTNSICVCSPEYYFFDGQTCVESKLVSSLC